eukprot:5449721-Heterocapsa_arctica.AAC.1
MTRRVIGHRKCPDEHWTAWWRRTFTEAHEVVAGLPFCLETAARQRMHRLARHAARSSSRS